VIQLNNLNSTRLLPIRSLKDCCFHCQLKVL